jgi:hypothetical protein
MFTSTDGGETWSVPSIINDTWLDDRDAGLTYLGNGRMIVSWFNHPAVIYQGIWRNWIVGDAEDEFKPLLEGFLEAYKTYTPEQDRAGSFIRISNDYGKTWGDPIKTVVSAPHGPVKTVSGRLLYVGREFPGLPSRYRKDFDDSADTVPVEDREALFLYESFDGGESWEYVSKLPGKEGVANDKLCEPHLVETPDGEIIVAIRAHDDPAYDHFGVYFTSSKDGGKSWSDDAVCMKFDSGKVTCYEQRMCQLESGAIIDIAWCEDTESGKRLANHYTASFDGGKTWTCPESTGVFGQASSVCAIGGEKLIAIHAVRRDTERPGIYGYIVDFSERKWKIVDELLLWEPNTPVMRDSKMADIFAFLKFGQPSAILLSDGDLLMTHWYFDAGQYKTVATRIKL